MSLEEALSAFLAAKRAANRSTQTIAWYEFQLLPFARWLAAASLPDWFQPATFERYYNYLRDERGLAPTSVRGAHRALHALFGWMTKRKLVPFNPVAEVEAPKAPRKVPRRTAPEEYRQLLHVIPATGWLALRDRLMVHTLFLSGVRVAELVRLTVADFDVANRLLMVRKKGGDQLLIPLLDPVRAAFVAYLFQRPAWPDDQVFLACAGGSATRPDGVLTTRGVRLRIGRLCQRAGVPHLTPHRFRHGLARLMLDQGAEMKLIQRILGHERLSTTADLYAVWDDLAPVARQFAAVMAPVAGKGPAR
jgi:site-specific recombinase XerD